RLSGGLMALARECWTRGRGLSGLTMRKLLECPGEGYHDWNASLPGYRTPDARIGSPFASTDELQAALRRLTRRREQLRAEMIARQEEIDWLVYAAYGLV